MPVFHRYRLIHIHNPRCAGTSINKLLFPRENSSLGFGGMPPLNPANFTNLYGIFKLSNSCVYELDHLDYSEVKDCLPTWIWQSYTKFSVVREPWDRFVSEYERKKLRGDTRFVKAEGSFEDYCINFLEAYSGFDATKMRRIGINQFADNHFLPQWRYLGAHPKNLDPNVYVLRLESLKNDWNVMIADHGLDLGELPKANSLKKHPQRADTSVSAEIKSRIMALYELDYTLLGYQ